MIQRLDTMPKKSAHSGIRTVIGPLSAVLITTLSLTTVVHAEKPPSTETAASAKTPKPEARRVLWVFQVDDTLKETTEGAATDIPELIAKVTAQSPDTHIVASSSSSLETAVAKLNRPMPGCLTGRAPCRNPTAAAMQALQADILLRATAKREGTKITLDVTMVDPSGHAAFDRSFTADAGDAQGSAGALEKLAFSVVREIFKATGRLVLETTPPGATLLINGLEIGVSPLTLEVPVGQVEVEALAPNHAGAKSVVKVTPASVTKVPLVLEPNVASLIVDVAPATGTVLLDNVAIGQTGATLEVMPGQYDLEVRADGYRSRRASLTLGPDEKKVMSLSLDTVRPRLRVTRFGEVSTEAIVARRFFARAGYRFTSVSTGLSGSKGKSGGREFELENLTVENEVAPIRPVFGYHGFNLDAGYTWEHWGVVALGFAMLTSGDTADGVLASGDEGQAASLSNFLRLELKPLQLTYRHAYENLLPSIQTGFGYALTTFDAEGDLASVELTRSDVFWHFSIEANYYFASWWFGFAGLGVQRELTHDDSDTQLLMTVGAGLTFDSPTDVLAPSDLPPKEY